MRFAPLFVAAILCAIAAFGVWRFFSSISAHADAYDVILYNYEGNVSYTRKGVSGSAVIDFPILKGDVFKTGPESEADITFGYYAGVKISDNAEVEIASIQQISIVMKLKRGTLMFNSKKLPSGMLFEIDTPNSIAQIRNNGTQMLVRVEPGSVKASEARVLFTVRRGPIQVALKEASAKVNVLDGLSLDVNPDTFIPNARNNTEAEVESVNKLNQIPIAIPEDE